MPTNDGFAADVNRQLRSIYNDVDVLYQQLKGAGRDDLLARLVVLRDAANDAVDWDTAADQTD